jgi:malonyl-CoA/methylmalonyl-CoA synthetase
MDFSSIHSRSVIPWSNGLRVLAARFGDATAINDGHECLSYRALCSRAHSLGKLLLLENCAPGTSVATLLPNGLQAVWASYGVRLSGAAETPMNFGYTPEEVAWSAEIAGFTTVVTVRSRADEMRKLGLVPVVVEEIPEHDPEFTAPPVPENLPGRILFSSGTTGKPKGAVYSHGRRWIGEQMLKAALPFIPGPGGRILLMTPFSHGASLLTFAWCDHGGEVVLLDGADMGLVRQVLESGRIEAVFAPPTVVAKLAAALGDQRIPGVRCMFTGTQALTASLYRKAHALFGSVVRVTFGKTECINPITVLGMQECESCFASDATAAATGTCVGWPAPGVELHIHPEPGGGEKEDNTAESGEVWLRAMHMSNGLLDSTGFHLHEPDGWHRTGDQGYIDTQGRLWLTGRLADVIKTGGYRVNPDEVESVFHGLQPCNQVIVTSVPSDYWGEIIIAVAESARHGWEEEAIRRVAALSKHKRPRAYLTLDALPRNAQGKVSRKRVRELVLAAYHFSDGPYPEVSVKGICSESE